MYVCMYVYVCIYIYIHSQNDNFWEHSGRKPEQTTSGNTPEESTINQSWVFSGEQKLREALVLSPLQSEPRDTPNTIYIYIYMYIYIHNKDIGRLLEG